MERLNGGEFLLDLLTMTLEETEESTEIEDQKVLEQLTNLKTYILNPLAIKPIWIRFYNAESGGLVVARGELSFDGLFNIHVKSNGYDLNIHVEFTQKENANHVLIDDYFIDDGDATYDFVSNVVSGGTKLYKHIISFNGDSELTLFSKNNTPLTTTTLLNDVFDSFDFINAYYSSYSYSYGIFVGADLSAGKIYWVDFEEGFIHEDIDTGDITDTITEL